MLLQTNSYVVPKEKRTEHARLLNRFRQTLARLGCDQFEVYEQTGSNWSSAETTGRFVQIMRFRDRKHQLAVQAAEKSDPQAQSLIREFCDLIDFGTQQQQGKFAVGFYNSVLPVTSARAGIVPQIDQRQPGSEEQSETPQAAEENAAPLESADGPEAEIDVAGEEPSISSDIAAEPGDTPAAEESLADAPNLDIPDEEIEDSVTDPRHHNAL